MRNGEPYPAKARQRRSTWLRPAIDPPQNDSPQRALWRSVLALAVKDALGVATLKHRRLAVIWLTHDRHAHERMLVCAFAGYNHRALERWVGERREFLLESARLPR